MGERNSPYKLGFVAGQMPIPPVAENCTTVAAGPVNQVVEWRHLTHDEALKVVPEEARERVKAYDLDEFGASLHVCDADSGLEYLRFDCFDFDPHYHYVRPELHSHQAVVFDPHADGDPMEWTVSRLRARLPEMLEFAGAASLAGEVRDSPKAVEEGIDAVVAVFAAAWERAMQERALSVVG